MKHAIKPRFVTFTLAVFAVLAAPTLWAAPKTASAAEPTPCSYIDTVLDCYSSFATANKPEYNVSRYNETYKNLTYRNDYALTGTTCLWTSVGFGPSGRPGM